MDVMKAYAEAGVEFYRPRCGEPGEEGLVQVTEQTLVERLMVDTGMTQHEALAFMERLTDSRYRDHVRTLVDLVPTR